MASEPNYLLGQGEQYADYVKIKRGGGSKKPVYTFEEAKKRLAPQIKAAADAIARLPVEACPDDEAVAIATLHHEYLSKTAYPKTLIESSGLRAIGSRSVVHTPSQISNQESPSPKSTAELFLAGPRKAFQKMAKAMATVSKSSEIADDLIKIEEFRAPTVKERIQPLRSDEKTPLLEIVLLSGHGFARERMLTNFKLYLETLGIDVDTNERIDAGDLSFVALRAPKVRLRDIARFSFLRKMREMPRLRQLKPKQGQTKKALKQFDLSLPSGRVLDPTIRVAVFDGGFPQGNRMLFHGKACD